MEKINFEDGVLVTPSKVLINGEEHEVIPPEYTGKPLTAELLNKMQDYIEQAIRTEGGGGGDTLPIGAVVEFATDTVPNNWLLCNGQEVSRTYYAELFNAIGTTYGEGDGSTTFNLPDRQGLIAIGAGTHTDSNGETKTFVLGQEYGEYSHKLTIDEMPTHIPTIKTQVSATGFGSNNALTRGAGDTTLEWKSDQYFQPIGGDQPFNIVQPSIATNFIIKARQSAGVSASVIQEDGTPNETDVYSSEAVKNMLEEIENKITDSGKIAPTLSNGWTNSNFNPCYYRKIGNMVYIYGVLKKGSGEIIFTLPDGYRPKYNYCSFLCRDDTGFCRIAISNNGAVQYETVSGNGGEVSLYGISFFVD